MARLAEDNLYMLSIRFFIVRRSDDKNARCCRANVMSCVTAFSLYVHQKKR